MPPVALVTGANKGIGLHIVRKLAAGGFNVILAGRSEERVAEAQSGLQKEYGISVDTSIIDLDDHTRLAESVEAVRAKHGKIQALVNNAGMAFKGAATEPFAEQAAVTTRSNYFGTRAVTDAFLPILDKGARLVFVSSMMGDLNRLSKPLRDSMVGVSKVEELDGIMQRFIDLAASGSHEGAGFPNSAYSASKCGVTALSFWLAKQHPEFVVNPCCPGWCRTDMAGDKAPKSAEEGADTPSWLVLRDDPKSGPFYSERKEKEM